MSYAVRQAPFDLRLDALRRDGAGLDVVLQAGRSNHRFVEDGRNDARLVLDPNLVQVGQCILLEVRLQ